MLRGAGLLDLYRRTEGAPWVKIALIDGPIRPHYSLETACVISCGAANSAPDSASTRHATFVASILVGRGRGVLGLCPKVTLLSYPAVDDAMIQGTLPPSAVATRLAEAVLHAVRSGASVILIGLEFLARNMWHLAPLAEAIWSAASVGVRTVLPAGNTPGLDPSGLLSVPGVVPVGMVNSAGSPDPRCTWGPSIARQGLMAPGVDIPGAATPQGFDIRTGSSYAAAFTTGAFAMVLGVTERPNETIWNALLRTYRNVSYSNRTVPPPLDVEQSLWDLM